MTSESTEFGSKTYRAYDHENHRLSTGVVLENGSFLQVYPMKNYFYSLDAWKGAIEHYRISEMEAHATIRFEGEEEEVHALRRRNILSRIANGEDPVQLNSWLEVEEDRLRQYGRIIAQRGRVEPPPPVGEPFADAPATTSAPTAETTSVTNENKKVSAYHVTVCMRLSNGRITVQKCVALSFERAMQIATEKVKQGTTLLKIKIVATQVYA